MIPKQLQTSYETLSTLWSLTSEVNRCTEQPGCLDHPKCTKAELPITRPSNGSTILILRPFGQGLEVRYPRSIHYIGSDDWVVQSPMRNHGSRYIANDVWGGESGGQHMGDEDYTIPISSLTGLRFVSLAMTSMACSLVPTENPWPVFEHSCLRSPFDYCLSYLPNSEWLWNYRGF